MSLEQGPKDPPNLRPVTPFLAAREWTDGASLDGQVVIVGAPFDATTSFRPGTRFGPERIRSVSYGLETYSPLLDSHLSPDWLVDLGDLDLPLHDTSRTLAEIEQAVAWLLDRGGRPLLLGGEHTVSVGAIRAAAKRYPGLVIVQLDAHADWREEYLGDRYSHATTLRRAAEAEGVSRVIQIGIRSGSQEEFAAGRQRGEFYPGAGVETLVEVGERLARQGVPVYLTIDIDVLDPAFAPGTGTPEPGGWTSGQLLTGLTAWARSRPFLVGADLVEISPPVDLADVTSVVGAKITRELALLLHRTGRRPEGAACDDESPGPSSAREG